MASPDPGAAAPSQDLRLGPLVKIVSGGQTGADQGGLEAGLRAGLATGGWAPRDFLTEDGPQPELAARYGMEACSGGYEERTFRNVEDSDATVIFARNIGSDGSKFTLEAIARLGRPFIINPSAAELAGFIREHKVATLNVAGNRESLAPGIAAETEHLLLEALALLRAWEVDGAAPDGSGA
jgi:hypothetical protein